MKRRNLIQAGAATTAGFMLAGVPLHVLAAGKKGGVINAVVQPEPQPDGRHHAERADPAGGRQHL